MKLLQISSALDARFGGPPNVVINSHIRLQEEIDDALLLVVGQTLKSFKSTCEINSLPTDKIILFRSKKNSLYGKPLSLREIWTIYKLIKSSDVILSHQLYNFQNLYVAVLSKIIKKPFFLMPHGTLTTYQSQHHKRRKMIVDALFFNYVKRNCTGIAVASNVEFDQISDEFKAKTRKIGIGFTIPEKLTRQSKSNKKIVFVFLGRIAVVKRVDLTIKAFKIFSERYPDSILEIVGDGDVKLVEEMRDLTDYLGIKDKVRFHGWLKPQKKNLILQNSTFLVLNSENENFGMAAAEAQSFGIPVLVSRFVGYSEYVQKFNSGIIVEALDSEVIAEGMFQIAEYDYQYLSAKSKSAAQEADWSKVIHNWIRFLSGNQFEMED